jgi:TATA-box binding protein (TBP) (component of TFIID and TFIIIB)
MRLARNGVCTEYAPQRFHAIIMRLRGRGDGGEGGGCTALIFRSGRVVMTGVHCAPGSSQLQRLASRIATRVSRAIHRPSQQQQDNNHRNPAHRSECELEAPAFTVHQLRVRNLVGSRCIPFRIALHPLYQHLSSLTTPPQPSSSSPNSITVHRCMLNQISFPALRCTFTMPQQQTPSSINNNNNTSRSTVERRRCTALIFSTGRLIVTGLTELTALGLALDTVAQICDSFHSPQNI